MTSRSLTLALSKKNEANYELAIAHLHKIIRIFDGMKVGKTGHWKPVQAGVILATSSILYLLDYLLKTRNYKFVLTTRFTQDFLGYLFSSVRARQCVPHALDFKNILKIVTIAQYCRRARGSSYDFDEGNFLLDFLSYTRAKKAERLATSSAVSSEPSISADDIPHARDADIENYSPLWERLVVYDICGVALASVKKNNTVCDVCFKACLQNKAQEPHQHALLPRLNSFRPDKLLEVNDECYKVAAKTDLVFRSTREELMRSTGENVQDVLVQSLRAYVWFGSSIPTCHDIQTKLIRRFLGMRWQQYRQRRSSEVRAGPKIVHNRVIPCVQG